MKDSLLGLKPHLPAVASAFFSALFFIATLIFNYSGKSQHMQDVQADQERRLELLEKDQVTRREVDLMRQEMKDDFADVKAQVQAYRDEELKYHHRQ